MARGRDRPMHTDARAKETPRRRASPHSPRDSRVAPFSRESTGDLAIQPKRKAIGAPFPSSPQVKWGIVSWMLDKGIDASV
jgi:hypothetical protein